MGLDIFFLNDIANRLDALDKANSDALCLALKFGADKGQVQIARYCYRAALDHARRAFGLTLVESTALTFPVVVDYIFRKGGSL